MFNRAKRSNFHEKSTSLYQRGQISHGQISHSQNKSIQNNGAKAGMPIYLQKSREAGKTQEHKGHPALGSVIHSSHQNGVQLPNHTRQRFESAFASDLSAVRVHNDTQHNDMAKSLNAKAFTVGTNIYFNEGRYRPGTREGDRLLAHELTHVFQQSNDKVSGDSAGEGLQIGRKGDVHEQEADRIADGFTSGIYSMPLSKRNSIYRSTALGNTGSVIQCEDEDKKEEQGLDFKPFPPALQYNIDPFKFKADTGGIGATYQPNSQWQLGLKYQYGKDISLLGKYGAFSGRLGYNPHNQSGSLSLGYGAPLLPMPMALGQQADAAWQGATAVGGAIPNFMSDPIGAYQANSEHIGAMGKFGGSLGKLYSAQQHKDQRWGAGVNLSYNPDTKLTVGAGLQYRFF